MTPASALVLAFVGHFALVAVLYVWLTIERARAVQQGEVDLGRFAHANGDPERSRRVARNLSNQFEAPLFAYFAGAILITTGHAGWIDVAATVLFLFGRVVHTLVQTLTDNVALRGQVFVINFVGICALMAHVALLALTGAIR
jgi:hypothetical protein